MFMNEYEVDGFVDVVAHFEEDGGEPLPNLRHLARVLVDVKDWVNANSDGWPYWKAPRKPCGPLLNYVYKVNMDALRGTPIAGDPTDEETAALVEPIRKFLKLREVDGIDRIAPLLASLRESTTAEMLQQHIDSAYESICEALKDQETLEEWEEGILEVRYKPGTPFVILLGYGGPNIWIEHDTMTSTWELKGSWGLQGVVKHADEIEKIGEYVLSAVERWFD